jgi:signal transduction histidine kinase
VSKPPGEEGTQPSHGALSAEREAASGDAPVRLHPDAVTPPEGPKQRLLVVDDNPSVRHSLSRLLGAQYHVATASSAAEALERAPGFRPDLILCDIMMPQMDGFGFLRALRSDHDLREIPVILLSARSDDDFKLQGLQEGADDFLTKPFTPREILGRIEGHLKLARMRHEEVRRAAAAQEEAEEANRSKAQFLTTMSHELRTPLNAIAGYVEILELGIYGPVTPEQKQALQRIQEAQRHVLSLMNDVLDFAKLEAGRTSFELSEVSLHDSLDDIETMIAPQLIKKGLDYSYTPCSPHSVLWLDADRLRQVMLNLLSNAIKFTPRGGMINVSCDCESSTEHALVRVRDSGQGIPPAIMESVFEPFVQGGGEADSAGAGLGLSISRDLARAMGGSLTVESTLGEGSTFTLAISKSLGGAATDD